MLILVLFAAPLLADSKDETLRPLGDDTTEETEQPAEPASGQAAPSPTEEAIRHELEAEYREELERRLEQERKSYEGSLTSLWLANAAVWTVLIGFIIAQAVGARKRAAELARLKAMREEE